MTVRTDISEANQPYIVDPKRHVSGGVKFIVNVPVTANKNGGPPSNYDLVYLDAESFSRYLRSKGGRNDLAEDILKKVLGYPLNVKPD